ncbi:circadian clock-controlled protein daywake-like [Chironomus tepperi]|uniref:circadian clock-controlled protein daywake-like n=1 Tax=Chironomus tepperi TaxID=113505 RepID=UPI00391F5D21
MPRFLKFIVLLAFCDTVFALPNDIEKCRINDERCLINSSNKVLRKYYGGITEIDLQSLDPFMVDKLKVLHDYGVIQGNGTLYNIKLYGLKTATIERIYGFDKNQLEIHFKVPKFHFKGLYKAQAYVFGFHSQGEGVFTLNFYDFAAKLIIKLQRYTRNGKTYFKTVGSDISSTVRTGDIEATSLSRALTWLVNQGFDAVLRSSIKSYVGDVWTQYYEQKINNVLNKVPIEELFLP